MALTITRNPNLSFPTDNAQTPNEIQNFFGANWWTGLPPEKCRGYDHERKCLTALPLLNLKICSRQDVLDYFNNTWTLTELLFSALKNEEAYTRPPYHQLRHPLIFYYGHPAVLFINKLRLVGLQHEPLNLYLEKVLETGVDEMSWDDLSKNEMAWPTVEAVHGYRKTVYEIVVDIIKTHPDLDKHNQLQDSPLWALWMGIEHEKIHLETSSVLMRELPIEFVETPKHWPPLHSSLQKAPAKSPKAEIDYPLNTWKQHKGGKVHFGKAHNTPSYGWDNEYGHREQEIKDFEFTKYQISNGEYFEFVASGAYVKDEYWQPEGLAWRKFRNTKRPTFWAAVGPEGSHEYSLRTIFEFIPMQWHWPVEVNFHEAQAFARYKNKNAKLHYRLLTEVEFHALDNKKEDTVLQTQGFDKNAPVHFTQNFNFNWSSPGRVNEELYGDLWTWIEDQFNPLTDFHTHKLYDDFSTPCFDGKHQMILGGSFISCGHEASKYARFHFRPHFYQHAGFRLAATLDGSLDNGTTRLVKKESYVHPHREHVLDQMQKTDWWKHVEQPLELSSDETHSVLSTAEKYLQTFQNNFASMHPMGSAHDPHLNSVKKDFSLPYQSTKNLPQEPQAFDKLLKFIFEEMAPLSQLPGHPGYAAYVAGSGNMISNVAQMISQTLNPFTGHYMMAPGLVTLEAEVIQWFIRLMGFPEKTASGFLTTGSSLATLSALAMAREKLVKGKDYSKLTLYTSDQTHHCVSKAWSILGFAQENIRFIASSRPDFKIQTAALEAAIEKDLKAGFHPLMVVGSGGSTNTGAVDNLKALAKISKKHQIWFHVDGAYGALFKLTGSAASLLDGVEEANSVVFDLHKALGLSYGTGCLLVRDKKDMHFHYQGSKTYMPPSIDEQDLRVDYADISPELSRDYRGLRVWLPLKTWGIGPFVVNLEEKLKLSEWMHSELAQIPQIEILAKPQLTIQAFTLKMHSSLEKNNEATQKLLEKINQHGNLFLSACNLDGKRAIRLCFLGFRMHFDRLQSALKEIKTYIAELEG